MKSPAFRFYPSDFMGSPDVQAMDLQEVGAYTLLLCTAWLSERHGYLPDDDNRLRRWARMSKDEWAGSRDELLKKFPIVEPGWRANPRMVEEARKQEVFSASQREKAGKRWDKPKPSQTDAGNMPGDTKLDAGAMPSVSVSVSVSDTTAKKARTKTPRAEKPRKGLYEPVKDLIFRYYHAKNGIDPEWEGREGKALAMLLNANPTAPLEHWTRCLTNRFHSEVTHGDRPGMWIGRLSSFTVPLNQYNKPLNGGTNGNGHFKGKTESSLDAAYATIQAIENRRDVGDPVYPATSKTEQPRLPSVCG